MGKLVHKQNKSVEEQLDDLGFTLDDGTEEEEGPEWPDFDPLDPPVNFTETP